MIGHPATAKGKALEKAGQTQNQLSFRAGLSRPYISQLEGNLKSPTVAALFRICDALEVRAMKARPPGPDVCVVRSG